jgi:hypothetical protein
VECVSVFGHTPTLRHAARADPTLGMSGRTSGDGCIHPPSRNVVLDQYLPRSQCLIIPQLVGHLRASLSAA